MAQRQSRKWLWACIAELNDALARANANNAELTRLLHSAEAEFETLPEKSQLTVLLRLLDAGDLEAGTARAAAAAIRRLWRHRKDSGIPRKGRRK